MMYLPSNVVEILLTVPKFELENSFDSNFPEIPYGFHQPE